MSTGKSAERFLSDLNRAMALHQQNRLPEAEQLYRQLLRQQPGQFDVIHLLGTLLRRSGDLAGSQALLDRAVAMRPQNWAPHFNRGNTLIDRRDFAAAADSLDRAIALKRDHAEAYYSRAIARLELGNAEAARKDAEAALRLKPGYWDAALTLARSFAALNRRDEARQILLRLLAAHPTSQEALLQLARLLHQERDWAQEADVLTRALRADARQPEILVQIAVARRNLGDTGAALQLVDQAMALNPALAATHNMRGEILSEFGRADEALASFAEAIRLDPGSALAHTNQAHALSELGRLTEAMQSYQRALELAPDHAAAHFGLSLLHRYSPEDPLLARLRRASERPGLDEDERSLLFFALAKALEDTGETGESFAFLKQANALRKTLIGYRPQEDEELFAKLAATAPALMRLARGADADRRGPVPVFIVGMPRSGTTLIEQILSAGSQVKGAGELNFVKQHGLGLATGAEAATPAALARFADNYLAGIAAVSGGRPFVADKMPHNFRFLPLIAAALPQARILHVRRDPRAVCWSNYKHHFTSQSLGYAHDLDDIVAYYRLYDGLMRQWMALCGERIVEVSYERLTRDQEGETRNMIQRLSLPWEDAYLAPEANERLVKTASFRQVRQPVYRGSSEAWRAFAPMIGEAFDSLPETPD